MILKIKFLLRLFIFIFIGIPTLPIFWGALSAFGLILTLPILGLPGIFFGWLINDNELIEDSADALKMFLQFLIMPFLFWYYFTIGINPLIKLNL